MNEIKHSFNGEDGHENSKSFLTKRNILIASLFIIFLFLRFFSTPPTVLLSADGLKYLETAKSFPYHKLYNNQLYLLHPPFYPYTIHFFSLLFQDYYMSAVIVSLLSSVITFFILYKLYMMLTNNFNITFIVLLFYSLSVAFINASSKILKESFVIMLIISSIYFYIRGIKFQSKKLIAVSTIIGIILALTSDHIIFVFPAFILSYIFFNKEKINLRRLIFPNFYYIAIPLLMILLAYGFWSGIKFYQYNSSAYYPNGVEGTPLSTKDLGLVQVIDPHYFGDWTEPSLSSGKISVIKKLAFNFGYMINIVPFAIPEGLNFSTVKFLLRPVHIAYMIFIYLPLALVAFYGAFRTIRDFFRKNKIHRNTSLYLMGMFLVFAIPITQEVVSPRYIYTSYLFLFYFIAYGILALMQRVRISLNFPRAYVAVVIALLLFMPFWYYTHYSAISAKQVIAAQNTADFINNNLEPDAGIMAQSGYTVKLIYLTSNRILGLYPKPEKLMHLIEYYNISYIIFGDIYTSHLGLYSTDSIRFIQSNPDKFELITAIQEDYSDFYFEEDPKRTDNIFIYRVRK